MENKRLLFITTRRFWPTDSGRKLSLYHYCRGLHDVYGYEIYIYSFLEVGQTPKNGDDKPSFIHSVTYAKPISFLTKIKNIVCKSVFSRRKMPLQCSLFYSKENADRIKSLADDLDPQVVIVDMVRLAPYYTAFSHLACKKVLDMDDVLSKRYRRQIEFKNSQTNLMGVYAGNANGIFSKLAGNKLLKKIVLNCEARLMESAEKNYAEIYDSVILVSEKETEYLNKITNTSKAVTVTMGVDYEHFSESSDIGKEQNSLSFIGNLKVAANVDSLDIIATKILPSVETPVKLYVIGFCPDNIKEKYKSNDNIVFTGIVDDLRKPIKNTQVFLSPIAYGSGIKTKILEAMAMGMPVVTNSIGAEGLDVMDGRELVIKDDYADVVEAVKELLSNEPLRNEIGERGQRFIQQHHDWNTVYKSFERMEL